MHEILMPISIVGSFGAAIYFFTKVLTDYILKKKMIEKGYVNEESQSIFKKYSSVENRHASLKWGLIILSAGLSLIIIDSLDLRPESTMPYGIFTASVSLGFLIYYAIVRNELK